MLHNKNQVNKNEEYNLIKPIEIDLNQSKSANSFEYDNLVHRIAKDEFELLIKQRLEEINSYSEVDLLKSRIHETISILGGRGSGKSSFLLSMVKYIKNEYTKDIFVLKVTDPTLFENRQHILITIIALIKENVTECFKCEEKDEALRNEWRKSLQNLAEGLNLLDDIGTDPMKHDGWNDSKIILERGLDQALSGESLEDNFYKFIDKSLKVLKKKAILIAFDDIDTDFKQGEKVLETLRKYFRYPKIISLVAGDMNLFTKIIRQKNWKQFENLVAFDDEKILEIRDDVDHLEDQYLLKVLPARSRVLLENMYTLLNNYSFVFNINSILRDDKEFTKPCFLQKGITNNENDLFQQLNSNYFKIQTTHIKDYNNFLQSLTQLPIRTVTQFIESFMIAQQYNDKYYFIKQILSLFSSTFSKFNIKSNTLLSNENFISMLTNILINLDQDEIISLNESYRLKPIYFDETKRTIMFLLNIITNSYFDSDRSKIFEYFIKVGLTRELILGSEYKKEDILGYKEFVGLQEQETPVKMTRRYCAFISQKFQKNFRNGFVKTYTLKRVLLNTTPNSEQITREEFEKDSTSLKEHFLLNILFLNIKGSNNFGSIFPLIAIMSEFTQNISIEKASFIENQILNYSQFRAFNSYKHDNLYDEEAISDDQIDSSSTLNSDIKGLVDNISTWIDKIQDSKQTTLPVHILSKIWTRLYYSLEKISSKTVGKSFGDYIQLCVTQFLHSWVIETMLYLNEKVDLRNIISSDGLFINNYKKFKAIPEDKKNEVYKFTILVFNFPLWKYYLSEKVCSSLYEKEDKDPQENFINSLKQIAITKK